MKNILITALSTILLVNTVCYAASNPFKSDYRAKEIKYKYNVLKNDEKQKRTKEILNLHPSGYMTVEEYEKASQYREKTPQDYNPPRIERPSDFKYVPQPLYKIVKYNSPAGSPELSLGAKLHKYRQQNAQGIVSPDYSMLVYPAVYYYGDSASVACDLFVIPLLENKSNLERILSANVTNRSPEPILSTDKDINNFAAFRTLTPIDFSQDGSKLLVKEKLGSSQDGIWETKIIVYDFGNKTSYDVSVVREAISYYWKQNKNLNLDIKRWDIIPLGFLAEDGERIALKAYAYTGETPVYLGAWSIDYKGEQSRLISFDSGVEPNVSANGYKIVKDGVQSYQTAKLEEKALKKQGKIVEKQKKSKEKQAVKEIKNDYKYKLKNIREDYKDEYTEYKKLRSISGSTQGTEIEEKFEEYQHKKLESDIKKYESKIEKEQKSIEAINKKIQALNPALPQDEAEQEDEDSSENSQNETNDEADSSENE